MLKQHHIVGMLDFIMIILWCCNNDTQQTHGDVLVKERRSWTF